MTLRSGLVLTGDASGAVSATQQVAKSLDRVKKQTKTTTTATRQYNDAVLKANTTLKTYGQRLAGIATAYLGFSSVKGIITDTQSLGSQAIKTADALGVSVQALTSFQAATERFNIPADKATDILKDLQDKIGDFAVTGGGAAKDIFEQLNLSVSEFVNIPADQQLIKIAEALDGVQSQSEKIFFLEALASDASLLLPLLEDGAAGLKELQQAAIDSGKAFDRIDAEQLEIAEEATRELNESFDVLTRELVVSLSPALTEMARSFAEGTRAVREWLTAGDNLETVITSVQTAAAALAVAMAAKVGKSINDATLATGSYIQSKFAEIKANNAARVSAIQHAKTQIDLARQQKAAAAATLASTTTIKGHIAATNALAVAESRLALHTANLTNVTKKFSVTAGIATRAMGLLRGAFALLGGPAGIILTAISAITLFGSSSEDSAAKTDLLTKSTDELSASLKDMSAAAKAVALDNAEAELSSFEKTVRTAKEELAELQQEITDADKTGAGTNGLLTQGFNRRDPRQAQRAAEAERAANRIALLEEQLAEKRAKVQQISDALNQSETSLTTTRVAASDAAFKLSDEQQDLINKYELTLPKLEELNQAEAKLLAIQTAAGDKVVPGLQDALKALRQERAEEIKSQKEATQAAVDAITQGFEPQVEKLDELNFKNAELQAALAKFPEQYEQISAAIKEVNRQIDEETRKLDEQDAANEKLIESLRDQVRLNNLRGDEYVQASLKIQENQAVENALAKLNKEATQEQREEVERLARAAFQSKEAQDKAQDSADEMAKANEAAAKATSDAWDSAFDTILDGFDGLSSDLKSSIKDVLGDITSQFSKLSQSSASGGGGGLFSSLGSIFSGGSGGGFNISSALGGLSSIGGSLLGGALGGNSEFGGIGSSIGTGIGTALTPFLGPLGPLLGGALGGALGGVFKRKPSDKTQAGSFNFDDFQVEGSGQTGKKFSQENRDLATSAANVVASFSEFLEAETQKELQFGSLDFVVGNRDGIRLVLDDEVVINTDSIEDTLQQSLDLLADSVGFDTQPFKQLQQDGETLLDTIVRTNAQFDSLSQAAQFMGLQFDLTADAGLAAADNIAGIAGGLDGLNQKQNFFYQNFFTETERAQNLVDVYSAAIADFNVEFGTAIQTKDDLRDYAQSLDLADEAQAAAYVAALELAPAVDGLTTSLEAAEAPFKKLKQEAENFINGINSQIEQLTQDESLQGQRSQIEAERQADIDRLNRLDAEALEALGGYAQALSSINTLFDLRLDEISTTAQSAADDFLQGVNRAFFEGIAADDTTLALSLQVSDIEAQRRAAISQLDQIRADGLEIVGGYDVALQRINDTFNDQVNDLRQGVRDQIESNRLEELGVSEDLNADGVINELDKLIDGISKFSTELSDEAFDNTLSDSDREILFLEEWRDAALEQLNQFKADAGTALGDSFDFAQVNADIETVYAQRLEEIGLKYEDVVTASEKLAAEQEATAKAAEQLQDALEGVDSQFQGTLDSINDALAKLDPNNADVDPVTAIEQRYATESELIEDQRKAALQAYDDQLKAVEKFNNAALALVDTADSLLFGDLSTLTAQEQLQESQDQFNDAARRARNGDVDAVQELQGLSSQTLQLGREVFASSSQFTALFDDVQDTLRSVGATELQAPTPVDVSDYDRQQEVLRQRTVDALEALLQETIQARQEARNNVQATFSSETV